MDFDAAGGGSMFHKHNLFYYASHHFLPAQKCHVAQFKF